MQFSIGFPFYFAEHAMQFFFFFSFHVIVVVFYFHLDEHTYTPSTHTLTIHGTHVYTRAYTHRGCNFMPIDMFYVLAWLGSVRLTSELFVNIIDDRAQNTRSCVCVFFFQCDFFPYVYLFASFSLAFSLILVASLCSRVFLSWLTALPTGSHTLLRISVSFALFHTHSHTLSLDIDIHTQMYTYTFLSVTL